MVNCGRTEPSEKLSVVVIYPSETESYTNYCCKKVFYLLILKFSCDSFFPLV